MIEMERSTVMDLEEGNQDEEEEEEGVDYNNGYIGSSDVDINNENSQGSFVDFEEKVPPLRIKLPSESSSKPPLDAETSSYQPLLSDSSKSMQKSSTDVHSEEDDEADDQLEIIDENTIGQGEEGEPMIGVIINESSGDAQAKGGDRLADKDDLEESLHD